MEEKEFEELNDMFHSEGWKLFINNIEELEDVITKSAVDNAVSNDQWQYCRGQTHQLRSILGYENFITVSWEADQKAKEEDIDVDLI